MYGLNFSYDQWSFLLLYRVFSTHESIINTNVCASYSTIRCNIVIIKDTEHKMKEISGSRLKAAQINPIAFLLLILIMVNYF